MTPCEREGYKAGDIFKVRTECNFSVGSILVLVGDNSISLDMGDFELADGRLLSSGLDKYKPRLVTCVPLDNVKKIYPPEDKVTVTIDGKETKISRESAQALKDTLNEVL